MKVYIISILTALVLTLFPSYSIYGQLPHKIESGENERIPMLLVKHPKTAKHEAYLIGTEIKVWLPYRVGALKGEIMGFSGDTVFIDNKRIPLKDVKSIKRVDHPVHNLFKFLGPAMGTFGAVAFYEAGTNYIYDREEWGRPLAYSLSAGSLLLGFSPVLNSSRRYFMKRFMLEVIHIEDEEIEYDNKGNIKSVIMLR